MKAVEDGRFSDPIIEKLNAVDGELKDLKARRGAPEPVQVEPSEDLPGLYRACVDNLVATLSDGKVSGRAADELHELIETVMVEWDAELRNHRLEVRGNFLEMLNKTKPSGGVGFNAQESSLKLVAGVGFEPTTFRL